MENGVEKLFHGGDTASVEARFGRPSEGWIDLSTGINPHAYPVPEVPLDDWQRLPEQPVLDGLLEAARSAYEVPDGAALVAAPGTQALIQLLPRLCRPGRVFIQSPTYGEHAQCWKLAGHIVEEGAELPERGFDVAVAVSPNNPDGRVLDPFHIVEMASTMWERGGFLLLDGAFMDVAEAPGLAQLAGCPGLVVLRSFGKFYGLAGLRLGFACGQPELITPLEQALGPWAVGGVVARVGTKALSDRQWTADMRQTLAGASARLEALVGGMGLTKLGGTHLYHLYEHDQAALIFSHLAQNGILVRRFPDNERWLRFGLPGTEDHWGRLKAAFDSLAF